ncbi:hypothetical protein [Thermoactinospora rubra]|uniref:hypothetical protein n=1 Tax=Thermoactinospora rubra TaxID=1088767 RepID=UPI000A10F2A5|nr:hypothetical protein [Thermoactinospora rubra]
MRKVLVGCTAVQLALVILQFYLSTFGGMERPSPAPGQEGAAITWHALNGVFVIPVVSLITTIVAAVARASGRIIGLCAGPLLLALVQLFVIFPLAAALGATEERTTTASLFVFGFHAIVGVVMLWASVMAFRGARALVAASRLTVAA